jgi:hypothetical protein
MLQMMLASISGNGTAQQTQRLANAALARRMLGLAVVSSGFAVIAAHGLVHLFGG